MSDALDLFEETPSSKITITYPTGKVVEFGQELTPKDVNEEPQIEWEADPNKFYTLVMYDPDAPSRQQPTAADVKHWLVVNISGCDLTTGEILAEYIGSGPPKDTGLHRYIFLVFEHNEKIELRDEPKSDKHERANRIKWSMRQFRKKYNLGTVFAGNYFVAQWEPFVDERKKMTSIK